MFRKLIENPGAITAIFNDSHAVLSYHVNTYAETCWCNKQGSNVETFCRFAACYIN
jgi:hypothetical protein